LETDAERRIGGDVGRYLDGKEGHIPDDIDATIDEIERPAWREARRQKWLAKISPSYKAWHHLMIMNLIVGGGTAACLYLMDGWGDWRAWIAAPVLFVAANAFEWRIHRDWLHRRSPPMTFLYEQHTVQHHTMFVDGDMTWGEEPRLVSAILVPPFAGVLIVVGVMPLTALLWWGLGRNVGLVFEMACLWYWCSYEYLHLLCHVDPSSRLGRNGIVRFMTRHHSLHHEPRLMQKYNFNVNFPLWDWVRGSFPPPELVETIERERAEREAGRVSDRKAAA
jgi:hypothetical protein